MTKTLLILTNDTSIEFWHNLKTFRGVDNRCRNYASDFDSEIKQIIYCREGDLLK